MKLKWGDTEADIPLSPETSVKETMSDFTVFQRLVSNLKTLFSREIMSIQFKRGIVCSLEYRYQHIYSYIL